VTLTVFDFRRLQGEQWLNDAIMDSFISLIDHCDDFCALAGSGQLATRTLNMYFSSRLSARPGWVFL